MTNLELFQIEHPSDVYLEEQNHVYIHKQTGMIYPSVTTILESVKEKIDKDRIIPAMIKQYEDFHKWYLSLSSNTVDLIPLLAKYLRYKKYRDFTWANWEGREYKKYKKIEQYKSIEELEYELDSIIDRENNISPINLQKVYLTNDGQIMNFEQIEEVWEMLKQVANWYGSLIHQILEDFLLKHQHIVLIIPETKQKMLFDNLNKCVNEFSKKYEYCSHIFKFYHIENLNNFRDKIIHAFLLMDHDFENNLYVPEKIMFYEDYFLCGMSDMVKLHKKLVNFGIGDHKTNINFSVDNEYNKFLKPPFSHIEETDIDIYNLQITIYSLMYQNMTKRIPTDFWISYFNTKEQKFEKLHLNLYVEEAKELLEIHKENFVKKLTSFRNSGIFANVNERYHYYLTFKLSRDIELKKEKGQLSNNKEENRIYYTKFINNIVSNIQKTL